MRLAEALALHAEMQQRIVALRAQLEQGAARLSREQEQLALTEIEAMAGLLIADIMCRSRTTVWLRLQLNKRQS